MHTPAKTPAQAICARFQQVFGAVPRLFRAPGRVNLIGEHTDYNDGFVMPVAVGLWCWVAAARRNDRKLVVYTEDFGERFEADFSHGPPRPSGHWSDYPIGVAAALEGTGISVAGANLFISSEVPPGGGLGSSAAVEVATACALTRLSGQHMEPTRLARLCQQAEHEYAGVHCGIMDQFVTLHGAAQQALLLDCRSLDFTLLQLPAQVRLMICNTMVKHSLAAGEYNQRKADCEEALRLLSARLPGVHALRDVSVEQLEQLRSHLPEQIYRRARHVVTENARTQDAATALREGNLTLLGERMAESHASLRDDYEVSCKELDQMVEIASQQPGVHGSRMTGAGFGGCVVSVVDVQHAETFLEQVTCAYKRVSGLEPQAFTLEAVQAASEVVMP